MMTTKSNSRIKFLLILLCTVCMASSFSMFISLNHNTKTYASSEQTAQISGIQVRSSGAGGENFIVLLSDIYSNGVSGDITPANYNTRSKITIYTSENDKTGKNGQDLLGGWWLYSYWNCKGLFIAYNNPNDYSAYNGTTIYAVKIEAGCELPCGDKTYVTAEDVMYINGDYGKDENKNGAYNWTRVAVNLGYASLNGIQVRSAGKLQNKENYGTENFIVLTSNIYNIMPLGKVDIASLNTREKIKVYAFTTVDMIKPCSELIGTWYEYLYWKQSGLFMAFDNPADYQNTYNGKTIYKIVIEAGCQLPYGQYGYYTTSETYTYYNTEYGQESVINNASNWTDELTVEKQTISLDGLQMRGWADNAWYQFLVIQSSAFSGLAQSETINMAKVMCTLDKIRLYLRADDTVGKSLAELTVQHIGVNFGGWTNGLFINFTEYATTYGGDQVYKVTVEKGCELLAATEADKDTIFVVDRDYTYINDDYGNESNRFNALKWKGSRFTATFKADGEVVATREFFYGDSTISDLPEVPAKDGYTGSWASYDLPCDNVEIYAQYFMGYAYGRSISLEGEISVNFYIRLLDGDAMVTLAPAEGESLTLRCSDSGAKTIGGVEYRVFSYGLAAKNYDSEVTLTVTPSDKTQKGISVTSSVKEYAEETVADNTVSTNLQELAASLLDYCSAAKSYFGGETVAKYSGEVLLESYKPTSEGTTPSGVTLYGAALVLESKTTIKVYFGGTNAATVSCMVNGEAVTQEKEGDYYVIAIENIAAQNLSDTYEIKIGGLTINYSALSYAYAVVSNVNETDTDLINLVKYLYDYNLKAKSFFLTNYSGNDYHISSATNTLDGLNEFNRRLLCYDDMRVGSGTIPEDGYASFNIGWQASSLMWHNAAAFGKDEYGNDKKERIFLSFLNSRGQDDYGYIYNQGTFREDPFWGGTADWGSVAGGPQGWTFPTFAQAVGDPLGTDGSVDERYFTSFDFNYRRDKASSGWASYNGSIDTDYTSSILVSESTKTDNGYATFSSDSVTDIFTIYRTGLDKLLSNNGYGGISGKHAAFVEIDMDFTSVNLDDIMFTWQTMEGGSMWYSASAKEYVIGTDPGTGYIEGAASDIIAGTPSDYSSYGGRSYWAMYLNPNWYNKTITSIGLQFNPKSGTKMKISNGKLNYIRCSYDTRQPQFAFQWFEAFYNYFCYTQNSARLQQLMPKARKAILFMLHCMQGESGLVNLDFFCGHNGIGTEINGTTPKFNVGEGLASGYWDTLALPEINIETNAYFYNCLMQMAEIEKFCEDKNISVASVSIKNKVMGGDRVYYDYNSAKLYRLADTVKAKFSENVNPVLKTDGSGRYTNDGGLWNPTTGRFALGINELTGEIIDHGYVLFNEQAVTFGLGTDEQRLSVMSWVNGDRTVAGDDSTGDDIYFYEFAPRFNTKDNITQINFALASLHFGSNSVWAKNGYGNGQFSRQVQNGGAVIWASYYDLLARAQVLGVDNAYARLEEITEWYKKVKSTTTGTGADFFKNYYSALESGDGRGYYVRQAANSDGAGAIGVDSEFLENVILIKALPEAFFGMKPQGLNGISFTNGLPSSTGYLKLDNLSLGNAVYSVLMMKNETRLTVSSGEPLVETTVTLKFAVPAWNYGVYINGKKTSNYQVIDGFVCVNVPFGNVTVSVK